MEMISKIFRFTLRLISKIILFSIGWNISSGKDLKYITETNKAILIFPHSSYYDYIFFSLYYYAYKWEDTYTVMSERYILFPSLCKTLIPAPDYYVRYYIEKGCSRVMSVLYAWSDKINNREVKRDYKKTSYVEFLKDYAKDMKKCKIIISPTGSVSDRKWKSGYYHIANGLNFPIVLCGVDYKIKNLVAFEPKEADYYNPKVEGVENTFDSISCFHNTDNIEIFNKGCILNLIFFLLNFSIISKLSIVNTLINCVGYIFSNFYYSYGMNRFAYKNYKLFLSVYSIYYSMYYNNYISIFSLIGIMFVNININKHVSILHELIFGLSTYFMLH